MYIYTTTWTTMVMVGTFTFTSYITGVHATMMVQAQKAQCKLSLFHNNLFVYLLDKSLKAIKIIVSQNWCSAICANKLIYLIHLLYFLTHASYISYYSKKNLFYSETVAPQIYLRIYSVKFWDILKKEMFVNQENTSLPVSNSRFRTSN